MRFIVAMFDLIIYGFKLKIILEIVIQERFNSAEYVKSLYNLSSLAPDWEYQIRQSLYVSLVDTAANDLFWL
jgi:hypothetical protein